MTFKELIVEAEKYKNNTENALEISVIVKQIYGLHYTYIEYCRNRNRKEKYGTTDLKDMIEIIDLKLVEDALNNNREVICISEMLTTDKQRDVFLWATNFNNNYRYHQYMHKRTSIKPGRQAINAEIKIKNALKTLESYNTREWKCLEANGLQSTGVKSKTYVRKARQKEQVKRALTTLEVHNTDEYRCLRDNNLIDLGFPIYSEDIDYTEEPTINKTNPHLLSKDKKHSVYCTQSEIDRIHWKKMEENLIKNGVTKQNARLIYNYYR